ncbi:MAG: ribbon-helix-helix domain-containing protein [Acetobacteraceae bacterium]
MAVRPSLHQKPPARPSETVSSTESAASPGEPTRRPRSTVEGYRPPSRQGKRAAVAWLEPEAIRQLNIWAIQNDRNVQDILVEAINEWFAARGLPRFDAERR